MKTIEILTLDFLYLEKGYQKLNGGFNNRTAKGCSLYALYSYLVWFSWCFSYNLRTRGHFELSPSLLEKYYIYCTS